MSHWILHHCWVTLGVKCLIEKCATHDTLNLLFLQSDTRFSSSMLYYGLSLNVGSFGLNIFLTQFIFGIVEIPAVLSNFVLTQRLGRRLSQAGFLFFGGAACLLILAIPKGTETCMLFLLFDFFFHLFLQHGLLHSRFRPSSGGYSHRYSWEIFCICLFQLSLCLYSRTLPHHFEVRWLHG